MDPVRPSASSSVSSGILGWGWEQGQSLVKAPSSSPLSICLPVERTFTISNQLVIRIPPLTDTGCVGALGNSHSPPAGRDGATYARERERESEKVVILALMLHRHTHSLSNSPLAVSFCASGRKKPKRNKEERKRECVYLSLPISLFPCQLHRNKGVVVMRRTHVLFKKAP
jgi:hypothetical protein